MPQELAVADATQALSAFSPKDYNVIAPVVPVLSEGSRSPYLAESVSVVKISADEAGGEVYTEFRYANARDGKRALTSLGLKKIADAAGIRFLPTEVVDRDRWYGPDGTRHARLHVRAAAAVRMLNGEWSVDFAEKEIDTEDWAEQRTAELERKLAAGRAGYKAEEIPSLVKRDLLAFREHLLSHAETRARSRLIRRVLALPQVFHVKDLERPFAVPRLVFRPDLAGAEEIERLAIIGDVSLKGSEAIAALYGARGNARAGGFARELEPEVEFESPALEGGTAAAVETPSEPAAPVEGEEPPARKRATSRKRSTSRKSSSRPTGKGTDETAGNTAAGGGGDAPDERLDTPPADSAEPALPDPEVGFAPFVGSRFSELTLADLDTITQDRKAGKREVALAEAWGKLRRKQGAK